MPAFESLEPLLLLLIALTAFASAVFHSVGGFAGALVLTIALAPILGVKETVPIVAAAMIISNTTRVWAFRKWINWRVVAAIFTAALPGIILGAIFYIRLPVHYVALLLGIFLIVVVPLRRSFAARNFKVGLNGLRAVAVPYGFVGGSVMGAGLMLAPFLLGAGVIGGELVAVVAALGLGLNLSKTIIFGLSPLLDAEMALKGLLIGICTIPGAFTGRWIVTHTPLRIHTLFMEGFILAGGCYFLWRAAEGFGWL